MQSSRRYIATLLATAASLAVVQAAWAVPSLQLTFEEADNLGSNIVYDPLSATTRISADGPVVLTMYAQSTAFDPDSPTMVANLTFNLDASVFGEFDDPNGITVLINGVPAAPTWTWGRPPLEDNLGDLALRGEYPAWYAEEFTIEVLGGASLHLDLYKQVYDSNSGPVADEVSAFAPFSHEAGITGIPEPATLAMFLTGGWLRCARGVAGPRQG